MKTMIKIPVSIKLSYGLGAIAYAVPYQVMASFFLFYITAVLHISPIIAGIIVAVSVIWDAITDPWVGSISDRTQSKRFGRRHLHLLLGGTGTAIGSYLLWSISPDLSEIVKITMIAVLVIFTKTTLTFYGAPYFAIGGTMSKDYDERSSIQGYRATFHILGMIIAIVGSSVLFFRSTDAYPKGQLNPAAYPKIALALAVLTFVVTLLAVLLIPKDRKPIDKNQLTSSSNIWIQVKQAFKNKSLRAIIAMIFLVEIGFQISISMSFHINTYVYNLTGPQIGLLGLTILGFSILSQPLWIYLSRKFEKKTALYISMVFAIIGFTGNALTFVYWEIFQLNMEYTLKIMIGFGILSGIGNGAFMTLPFSIVSDTVDEGELLCGERQEGLFFGIYNFAYKTGISISILISGLLLDMIGFQSTSDVQPANTVYNLAMVPTWLLLFFTPFIAYALSRCRITRQSHKEVLEKLKN